MSFDSSRSYDRRSPKWTPSPTAGSRSYYASWKESLRNECLEKARKRREDRANTYRCCGVSPEYSTEREAQSLITETLGHPGTPGQLIGNFVYSTPVQGYSWRNDFYLSDNELFQLMQEVQEELQREGACRSNLFHVPKWPEKKNQKKKWTEHFFVYLHYSL